MNYLLSREPKIGEGTATLKLENGVFKGSLSNERLELTKLFAEKNMELELTKQLVKFGDCIVNFKIKGDLLPSLTLTAEFKYTGIDNDGISYTAYHCIELIIKSTDFWDKVGELAKDLATIIAVIVVIVGFYVGADYIVAVEAAEVIGAGGAVGKATLKLIEHAPIDKIIDITNDVIKSVEMLDKAS